MDDVPKILLVDDRPENLVALEASLSGLGCELARATSGEEALRRLLGEDFSLILLDVQMPGMDGYETAELLRARERSRNTPIIFLTAIYKDGEHVRRGYSVGAVDYVFKPYSPDILCSKVARFVELSQNAHRLQSEVEEQRQASAELLRLNGELEVRVQQRTAELEQANARLLAQSEKLEAQNEALVTQNEVLEKANVDLAGQAVRLKQVELDRAAVLSMLSHELRNPLAVLWNGAHLMAEIGVADARLQTLQRTILRQCGYLRVMFDELLDASRAADGKIRLSPRPLDLTELARSVVEDFGIEEPGAQVETELPAGPLYAHGDSTRLYQVMRNLLNNAVEHGRGGPIRLSLVADGEEAILRVRDHGDGIPADLLPRIFELFVRHDRPVPPSQGGLGVGLTVVRDLVRLHGGTVQARSDGPGAGAEFTVRLPLNASVCETAAPCETPAASEGQPSRRVLVVDDNPDAADTLAELLGMWEFESRTAYSGEEGLQAAAAFQPDVFILDIGLPGMSGYDLARRLRSEGCFRDSVFVALTGFGQDQDRRQALDAGFDCHLQKPPDLDELHRFLRAATAA